VSFSLWLLCAFSQLNLVQSGSAMVKPSEPLKLTCAVSGNSISSSNWWSWFRRTHGQGLEWMGLITSNGNTIYAPSLQTRVAITRDAARNEYYLQVHSAAPADTGTYYCARDIYLFGTMIETISNTGKETTVRKPAICPPLRGAAGALQKVIFPLLILLSTVGNGPHPPLLAPQKVIFPLLL
uniref:Ig-like domain-containing protein n=1 Tax=Chrysemys picta bellii TaxID=8478 RepID=A0A8C3HZQ0_CHRPI